METLYNDSMQNKQVKQLNEIAEIILGYTFRNSLSSQEDGNTFVVQARNISEYLSVKSEDLLKIHLENNRAKSFAKNNDVVLSSRGIFKSSVIKADSDNLIASASVYLLRLKTAEVIPEYLAIFLNSEDTQKKIQEKITGAVIKTLLKKEVGEIEIVIPNLDDQKKIVAIYFNNLEQKKLLNKKIELTNQISKGAINKIIKF